MIEVTESVIDAIAEKFHLIEKELSEEKGEFVLFGLFEREDTPDKWDVIISAYWIGEKKSEAVHSVASKINSHLSDEEKTMLSRIVVLDPSDTFVKAVNSAIQAEHNLRCRFTRCIFFGIPIHDAFIITSKTRAPSLQQTNRSIKKTGRNEPCTCGSGKKYKRCCGQNK